MSRLVVKVGGSVAEAAAAHVLTLVAEGHECVVVHGGGPQISAAMERRALAVSFAHGRRVTDEAAIVVVREALLEVNAALCAALGARAVALAGDEIGLQAVPVPELGLVGEAAIVVVRETLLEVNAALCAALGARAVALAGDEIGLQAVPVPELGLVGKPLPSRPQAILEALEERLIPVVAPLAEGPLNVNADEAAAALAVGLGAERIVFLTNVPGVLRDEWVLPRIEADEADRLVGDGTFEGGIVPKLEAAVRAARLGVRAEIGLTEVVA